MTTQRRRAEKRGQDPGRLLDWGTQERRRGRTLLDGRAEERWWPHVRPALRHVIRVLPQPGVVAGGVHPSRDELRQATPKPKRIQRVRHPSTKNPGRQTHMRNRRRGRTPTQKTPVVSHHFP